MAGEIPQHISRTEQRLHKLQQFQSEVSQLQQWLTATRALLEAQHHPVSATSVDQDDSIVVDPQVRLIDYLIHSFDLLILLILVFNICSSVMEILTSFFINEYC